MRDDYFRSSCEFKSFRPITLSLTSYGANVTTLKAPLGGTVPLAAIESALAKEKFKIVTVTHVDTSTGLSGAFSPNKKRGRTDLFN